MDQNKYLYILKDKIVNTLYYVNKLVCNIGAFYFYKIAYGVHDNRYYIMFSFLNINLDCINHFVYSNNFSRTIISFLTTNCC